MRELRSERADFFWHLRNLPRWEQLAFTTLNMPFSILILLLNFLLWIPFHIMILLKLPFLLFTLVGSVVWFVCLAVMLSLSLVTERIPALRPFAFVLALPFLIIAHNLNGLTPALTPRDIQAKVEKWDLVETFPLTWSLFRFFLSDDDTT